MKKKERNPEKLNKNEQNLGELEKTEINKMKNMKPEKKKTEKDGKKRFRLVYSQNSQKLQKSSQKLEKKYITIMPVICLYNLYLQYTGLGRAGKIEK